VLRRPISARFFNTLPLQLSEILALNPRLSLILHGLKKIAARASTLTGLPLGRYFPSTKDLGFSELKNRRET